MNNFWKSVCAGVVASTIFATGMNIGAGWKDDEYKQQYSSAPAVYTSHIGDQIIKPVPDATDIDDLLVRSKSIISIRDDLRSTLTGMGKLLNSDIDTLTKRVKELEEICSLGDGCNGKEVEQTLKILQEKWPSKVSQVDVEIRKLLAELGLVIKGG